MGDSVKNLIDSFLNSQTRLSHEDTLKELDQLSHLTEASLEPILNPVSTTPAPVAVASNPTPTKTQTQVQTPAPAPIQATVSARHQSKNLQDSNVLKALLDFHHSRAPIRGAKSPDRVAPAIQAQRSPEVKKTAHAKPTFAAAEIPIVEAQPKNPIATKRSSMPTQTILKKK